MNAGDYHLLIAALLFAAVLFAVWIVFGPLLKDHLEYRRERRSKFASDQRPES